MNDLEEEIENRCRKNFGRKARELGIILIKFDGKKGIVSCDHKEKMNVINLMNSIDNIRGKRVDLKTIGTSGTIKSATKKYLCSGKYADKYSED